MKKFTFLFTAVSILFITSCADNNDLNVIDQENATSRLQSYTLKKDAQGNYTIDIQTKQNTKINSYKTENSNDLIISDSRSEMKTAKTENLGFINNSFEVQILDEINGKTSNIQIIDETSDTEKNNVTEFLRTYSITKNQDGSYTLDFEVNDNVITDFIYNEEIKTYEVHLSKGVSGKSKVFTRTLRSKHYDKLRVDFVNHINTNLRNKSDYAFAARKPRVAIDNDND